MTIFTQDYLPDGNWFQRFDRQALAIGLLLLGTDVVFLLLHVALNFDFLSDRRLHIEVDNGYAEQFQYLKFLTSAALLLYLGFSRKGTTRIFLAGLLLFLLFEDIARIHEDFYLIGERFIALPEVGPLTNRALWELIYGLTVGGLLLGLLVISVLRTYNEVLRKRMVLLCLLLVLFGGFGVAVDAVHGLLQQAGDSPYTESLLGIVEDWGEMITVSLMAMLVVDDVYRTAPKKVLSGGPR
ncbi:hypothetical protein CLV84_0668 [Neolewinella xylanilytica]|uniref:Uncharacterized protein n=1 Tax=Neolewinella xylanilytica TaxID=1514080 RepID=A0A2S6I8A4_9BACT|nr:hypothetical protein [Neolewinella xylanilytica]PPK87718.1 hypothetical protein CLV84_0668 [Neolewinella xylanilytica]